MKRYYAVTMSNGDIYGIPAHVIADNYANYYATKGEDYLENYDAMLYWFDTNDYEFADWAKTTWIGTMCKNTLFSSNYKQNLVIFKTDG